MSCVLPAMLISVMGFVYDVNYGLDNEAFSVIHKHSRISVEEQVKSEKETALQ